MQNYPKLYLLGIYGMQYWLRRRKHRPVLVTRTYPNPPTITVLPLTTQRLNDGKQYHVDLEKQNLLF